MASLLKGRMNVVDKGESDVMKVARKERQARAKISYSLLEDCKNHRGRDGSDTRNLRSKRRWSAESGWRKNRTTKKE